MSSVLNWIKQNMGRFPLILAPPPNLMTLQNPKLLIVSLNYQSNLILVPDKG